MVTPPLVGVLVLLQLGRGLTPPRSVKGAWALDLDASGATNSLCGRVVFQTYPATMTVVQSGPMLGMAFNDEAKTMLSGRIDGRSISAGDAAVQLHAEADIQPIPDRLSGQLSVSSCGPTAIPFSAVRTKAADGH
jgi:hypothetical protein